MVPEGTSLDDIVHTLAVTSQRYFPVVDDKGLMVGIFSAEDVRSYLFDDAIWRVANARDVMVGKIVTVTPEDDLNTALPAVHSSQRRRVAGCRFERTATPDRHDPPKGGDPRV